MTPPATTIGTYIRELRERKGWSLFELSKQSGLNYQHLSRIASDSVVPNPETVVKLAETLDGNLDTMLELADCLPRQILERLSARSGQPALRRQAGPSKREPVVSPNGQAEALARSLNVPDEEVDEVADAMVRFLTLDARRRQAVVQLMKTFDGGGGGGQR
jgi:transcriptional regulator with XRE-family HTH domain